MIPAKPFYMIRHGESTANKEQFFSGDQDVPLTALGVQQAQEAQRIVEALEIKPNIIVHSHLSRARDTAITINQNLNIDMIENKNFAEQFFGDWQGCPSAQIVPMFLADHEPPNGETCDDFRSRIKTGFQEILPKHQLPLIVCHGGVFGAFYTMHGQAKQSSKNCKLYKFTPYEENQAFPWAIELIE